MLGFALGIEVKILFAHLQSKKIETNSPPERPNGMQPYIKIGEELGRKVKANDCYLKSSNSKFKYYFIYRGLIYRSLYRWCSINVVL